MIAQVVVNQTTIRFPPPIKPRPNLQRICNKVLILLLFKISTILLEIVSNRINAVTDNSDLNSDFTNFVPVGFHNYTVLCLLMKHTHYYFSSLSKVGREEEGEEKELDESDNTLDQTIEKKTFK
jgi:hypothetical protein